MNKIRKIYYNIVIFLFKSAIEDQIARAIMRTLRTLSDEICQSIHNKGWDCDDDMVASEYADIVESRIQAFYDIGWEKLYGKKK